MLTSTRKCLSGDRDAVERVIRDGNRFLLTTHVNADPDALGSELALAEVLRLAGKTPLILNPTPVSPYLSFLDPAGEIGIFEEQPDLLSCSDFDAVFILDISRWERLGPLSEPLRLCRKPKVCIDHHPYTGGHADYHLVNTDACASAEILYDLIQSAKLPMNERVAECLYASILADTGSFSFSNTTANSHRIAADLLGWNVPGRRVYEQLFQNQTPARLRFLGQALSSLQFDRDETIAWMTIRFETLRANGLRPEDADGFVDHPRNCRNVLLSILFLETAPDDIKISLRAKGDFNANRLASLFDGGGHNHASGIRMKGKLEEVEQLVLAEARKAMREIGESRSGTRG